MPRTGKEPEILISLDKARRRGTGLAPARRTGVELFNAYNDKTLRRIQLNRLAVVAIGLLFALSAFPVLANAQSQTNWLSAVSIVDLTGNSVLQASQPLLAGHSYNVTMDVTVPFNQTGTTFSTTLSGGLLSHGAQFWYVKTPNYAGYNASTFNPASHTLTFNWVAGTLTLSAVFEVPISITQTVVLSPSVGNITLHTADKNFAYVIATVPSEPQPSQVGNLSATIEDQSIQTYLSTYQQKSVLISSGQISSTYSAVVDGILNQSQALYKLGLPDQGTSLLNTITPSEFPAPPSTTMSTLLLVGLGGAAVIIVLLAVVLVRGRGKSGFASGIVSEVQKELAILEVTAAKYDKNLADRLQALRNKLGETD